ncbi:TPA: response regulator [Candidatus Saccharibacteria bacterium]|nr:response regulator [Candidatus Saccharibacteria bacterium]HIO87610.1 response regulator [Candidatus Saccharibacteria bacterium]
MNEKKILCIEDDMFISEMYTRALRKAGYEVDEVSTGPDGISQARKQTYDLILLDIFIPERTGIEVLADLRGADGKGLPDTKIVIMTNYAQDDMSKQALETRADGYFIKADITPKSLVALVKQVIG